MFSHLTAYINMLWLNYAVRREAAGLEEDGDQDNEIMQSEDEEGPSSGNDPASARKK